MGYFILEVVLFLLGSAAVIGGRVPLSRRRFVSGSAARVVGFILMMPLPLFLTACRRSHVPVLGYDPLIMDPLMHETDGFVRLIAMASAFACLLAATALAIIASEHVRRP